MKHAANLISASRIILLIFLFFTFGRMWLFVTLYLLCGLSDVLDGYVARRTGTQSILGARLDSLADILLFSAITVSLINLMGSSIRLYIPWIIAIALIRSANLAIGAYRYHCFASLHTWGNKLAGGLLFLTPLLAALNLTPAYWLVIAVACLSALEETIIHLTSPTLDLNRPTIFAKTNRYLS